MSGPTNFEVGQAQEGDIGRRRVRVHYKKRSGSSRHGIVVLTAASGKSVLASVLGHELDQNLILMDYDVRAELGVSKGQKIELIIERAGLLGKLRWYLGNADPAVHIPAWIAIWSLFLGIAGIAIGLYPLVK
ncbi:hypothetical protein [Bosea sp. PAMC 26642]|uniref:hypothetical protein n=1 Tax=Bosea sp. (strain PAMC 26642) TaxID=1792307 RepID=UPI00077004CE|nr:hypothetical protein [Bosea sp. PAMC 26642]AMJ60954.1 hypothetical protein AXW83_12190 [Bosea sp. PAMC 26642]